MKYFDEATLRLKQQLKLVQDKDVAEALGLSARAWAGRKKNDLFPREKVLLLATQRPDLRIDVQYVLADLPTLSTSLAHQNATRAAGHQQRARETAVAQAQLLAHWQQCSSGDQRLVCEMAARLASNEPLDDDVPVLEVPAGMAIPIVMPSPATRVKQHNKGDHAIQIGQASGPVRIKQNKGKKA